jgi:hypothetical protein
MTLLTTPSPPTPSPPLPRLVIYHQTHHTHEDKHISILPLITQPGIHLTHLMLAAFHINGDPDAITLNDHLPSHPRFTTLWAELRILQASGVRVLAMLGGAAQGSFTRLDSEDEAGFEMYYGPLAKILREKALDGIDLDIEEPMSLRGVIRLIDRLRADFGPDFLITMAPVAAALLDARRNMSGFDYEALEVMRGSEIAWYNAQFYCGWGDCSNPLMYEMILLKGWLASKVVIGMITNPGNGSGWVPWDVLANMIPLVVARHADFGGVMGWEYFNSLPGGEERPWEWAKHMTGLMRGQKTAAQEGQMVVAENSGRAIEGGDDGAAERQIEVDVDGEDGQEAEIPDEFEYYSNGNEDE